MSELHKQGLLARLMAEHSYLTREIQYLLDNVDVDILAYKLGVTFNTLEANYYD